MLLTLCGETVVYTVFERRGARVDHVACRFSHYTYKHLTFCRIYTDKVIYLQVFFLSPINEGLQLHYLYVQDQEFLNSHLQALSTHDRVLQTGNACQSFPNKKKNKGMAHELGHFELHRNSPMFLCEESDFVDWHRYRPEETEANQFAAELLMPHDWFMSVARSIQFSIEEVARLAEKAGVSLTAAAFRCVELDVTPCAITFCQNNEIKWSKVSESFPYQYMRGKGTPDGYSGAGEYFLKKIYYQEPTETPADAWFRDYEISNRETVMEQCLIMKNINATMSFIRET